MPSPQTVFGVQMDEQTRCCHYFTSRDVVAIKFKCCGNYYACYECHLALTSHESFPWKIHEHDVYAILCGCCRNEMRIEQYLRCDNKCLHCRASFNPNCRRHHHLYFTLSPSLR